MSASVSRRHALLVGAAALLSACTQRPAPPSFSDHVARDDFPGAAGLIQSELEEEPRDRLGRLILGKLRFGALEFGSARDEFQRIEGQGGLTDDLRYIDVREAMRYMIGVDPVERTSPFGDNGTWLYLATLRLGSEATPPQGPAESIRSVVNGRTSVSDYVEWQTAIRGAQLDNVIRAYGNEPGIAEKVALARRRLNSALSCVAYFALAEQHLGRHETTGARNAFLSALASNAGWLLEHHITKVELARLA